MMEPAFLRAALVLSLTNTRRMARVAAVLAWRLSARPLKLTEGESPSKARKGRVPLSDLSCQVRNAKRCQALALFRKARDLSCRRGLMIAPGFWIEENARS